MFPYSTILKEIPIFTFASIYLYELRQLSYLGRPASSLLGHTFRMQCVSMASSPPEAVHLNALGFMLCCVVLLNLSSESHIM